MTTMTLGRLALGVAVAGIFGLASACASDRPKSEDAPELANFKRTGKYETCLTSNRIDRIRILNRKQILFEMIGKDYYLAEPEHCPGLSKSLALSYDATINQLCNTTIVHLIDPGSPVPQRGTCGIDRFEKLEKKPKDG